MTRSADREKLLAFERGPPLVASMPPWYLPLLCSDEGFPGLPNTDRFLSCPILVPILGHSPKRDHNNNDDDNK